MSNMWTYRNTSWYEDRGFVGYDVEASNGSIGKVDESTNDTDSAHIVVDTGFWIFGKKRLIPAGAVTMVDHNAKVVMVNMTKDEIKSAPDYDETTWKDDSSRNEYDEYYGRWSW
ncbi:MAG TPA: PRC-barrel domain containing protein [Marmoricola sp.]|nr:PRC-barrel domain containing protein [Marmoricola sp.]